MLIFVISISATLLLSIAVLGFLFHKRRIIKNQSVETTKFKNEDLVKPVKNLHLNFSKKWQNGNLQE